MVYSSFTVPSFTLMKIAMIIERTFRLYEQGADSVRIGQYVLNWLQWTRAGIHELLKNQPLKPPEITK